MKDKNATEINLGLGGQEEFLALEMLAAEQAEKHELFDDEDESDNFSEREYLTDAAEGAGYEFWGEGV